MRTFARQQKPARRTGSAGTLAHARTLSSESRPAERMLPIDRVGAEAGTAASGGLVHDYGAISTFSGSPIRVQPKLTVNTPGDVHEQEADRVADQVMRMTEPGLGRSCACGGGGSASANDAGVNERLQRMPERTGGPAEIPAPPIVSDIVSSPGRALDPTVRGFMESRFGHDFSQVRVHTGPRADDATRAVQARAFTLSRDIVFGAGQYDPNGSAGRRLLAHELTHVIQQRAGAEATQTGRAPGVHQGAPISGIQRDPADAAAAKAADDAAFWEWWKLVVGFEGPLSAWKANPANKKDKGGETNWGVTKKMYMARAEALGLPPTEEGFAAMTPDQAMLFGRMMWKSSGASKVKNTGVALVLADWYWGGIVLDRLRALLKAKGRVATFKEGTPDAATIDFLNTLPPGELIELMSKEKAAQYHQIVKDHPDQKDFLKGWLKRNEERRQQAQPFVPSSKPRPAKQPNISLWERGQRALRQARGVLQAGEGAGSEDRRAASDELWAVVGLIEGKQKNGFAHAEEEMSLKSLKGDLLKEIGRLMDAGP